MKHLTHSKGQFSFTEFYHGLKAMGKCRADYPLRIKSLILKMTKMPKIMKNANERKTRMQELFQPQPCGSKCCSLSLQTKVAFPYLKQTVGVNRSWGGGNKRGNLPKRVK